MRRNPKYAVDLDPELLSYMEKKPKSRWELGLEWHKGRRTVMLGGRSELATLKPDQKLLLLVRGESLENPTTIHWLSGVYEQAPQLLDYKIGYHRTTWGSGKVDFDDTGYDGHRLMAEIRQILEPSTVRHGHDRDSDESADFSYLALAGPQDMVWYHATLAKNESSILRSGLLPPGDQRRASGWSPAWNMGLQNAVYLTSDETRARRIAETLAVRSEEPAVVLSVDGAGLEDTRLLALDEDAIRNDYDGTVEWDYYDADFPQWVTSFENTQVLSIAYMDKISPQAISVLARCVPRVEAFARGYAPEDATPETDPDLFVFETELTWSDGWSSEED